MFLAERKNRTNKTVNTMSEQSEQGMERGVERLEHEEFSFEVPTVLGEYVPNDMHVCLFLPTWPPHLCPGHGIKPS